jgi:lambda family phage tail tape measure protein
MAGNTIVVNVEMNDPSGSGKQRIGEAKEYNQELTKAAELSRKAAGVRAGYRGRGEGTEYNRGRGSMGATGASARDFAKESRGLGGLVQVYATVAANLFAVTAAFGALKDAMNTTNMVNGMNQLGSVSGVALGSMAQQFVQATDGAVSLREAMTSVTKASSAGLSNKQTLEIAKGAKQAAQALGLDMTDAVSRLTRGITKLEPELLDELGLYTKLGPAADKYALSLGKTAASLTDYEKRQGFAIAVLDELKQKFGEISLEANPWQKLEASIRNLATAGLELVNKVLVPIANVLANNSTLLGAVLAGLAFKLLKMAVPALASWRDELVKTAAAAKKNAADITESFASKNVESTMAKFNLPELQSNLDSAKAKYAKAVSDIAQIQKDQKLRDTKTTKNIAGGIYGDDPKDFTRTQSQINDLNSKGTAQAAAYADALKRAKDAKKDELNLTKQITSAQNQAEDAFQKSNMSEEARRRISRQAASRSESLSAISNVSENTTRGGFRFGLAELEKDLAKASNLSGWEKLKTRATGWGIAGATEVGIFIKSLGRLMNVIGVLAGAVGILDYVFGKNAAQLADFDAQVSQNTATVENAIRVYKRYGDSISAAGSIAKGNALGQLAEDVGGLADKLERADATAGWFDRFMDGFKVAVGKGLKNDFAGSVAANLAQQLKLIPEGPLKAAAEERLKEVLKVGNLSEEAMKEALANTADKDVVKRGRDASKTLDALSAKQKEIGITIKTVGDAVKTADDRFMELGQSLSATDPVSKFGRELMNVGIEVTKAFQDTESTVGAVEELLKKPRILGLLGPDAVKELTSIQAQLPDLAKQVDNYGAEVFRVQTQLEAMANIDLTGASQETISAIDAEKARISQRLGTLTVMLDSSKLNFEALNDKLNRIVTRAIGQGYDLIERMANAAQAQAALTISKNLLSGLSGPGISKAMGQLNIEDIKIQKEQNSIMTSLNNTMLRANALKERELAEAGVKDLQEKAKKGPLTADETVKLKQLQGTVSGIDIITGAMKASKNISREDIEGMTPTAATFGAQYASSTQGMRATNAALDAKKRIENNNIELGTLKEQRDEKLKLEQSDARLIDLQKQYKDLTFGVYEYLNDSQMAAKQQLETQKHEVDQALARRTLLDEQAGITDRLRIAERDKDGQAIAALNELKKSKVEQLGLLDKQQDAEDKILALQQAQARIGNEYKKINILTQDRIGLEQIQRDIGLDNINNQLELLGLRSQVQMMHPDEISAQEKSIKMNGLLAQSENDKAKAGNDWADKVRKIAEEQAKAQLNMATYDEKYFTDRYATAGRYYDFELERINQNSDAKQKALDLQYALTDRMKAYDATFSQAFQNMGQAMADFVMTGKGNFKDLISSMLQGLLQYEMKMQMLSLYSLARPGLFNLFGMSLPGAATAGTTFSASATTFNQTDFSNIFAGAKLAKGGAYDIGLKTFARGGMFTNSIVNEPTMFKFAQGTGLMGEAGPEAIMPLKRDSNGNLGVRGGGGGGSVEVVVNNYGNEKATTKETTDSRGNRKIEVVIGEMVAGELNRPGSSTQQAMRNGYGTAPLVARR